MKGKLICYKEETVQQMRIIIEQLVIQGTANASRIITLAQLMDQGVQKDDSKESGELE